MRNNTAKVMQKQSAEEKQSGTHRVAKKESDEQIAQSMADALADIVAWEIGQQRVQQPRV